MELILLEMVGSIDLIFLYVGTHDIQPMELILLEMVGYIDLIFQCWNP